MSNKDDIITQKGVVVEKLPNAMFKVKLENGHIIIAHSCGKIKKRKITIVVGDTVVIELSVYDLTKGRITIRENDPNFVFNPDMHKNKKKK